MTGAQICLFTFSYVVHQETDVGDKIVTWVLGLPIDDKRGGLRDQIWEDAEQDSQEQNEDVLRAGWSTTMSHQRRRASTTLPRY